MKKIFVAGICLGLFFLGRPGVARAAIANPSFESNVNEVPDSWTKSKSGSFGVDILQSSQLSSLTVTLPSDGDWLGRVYSGSGSEILAGEYGQWAQTVDLTNVSQITFDAEILTLLQSPFGQVNTLHSFLEAQLLIDGTVLWSKQGAGGAFLDQVVNTSGFSGPSALALRLYAIADSNGENLPRISSSWFMFDNLRETAGGQSGGGANVIPEPSSIFLFGVGIAGFLFRRK